MAAVSSKGRARRASALAPEAEATRELYERYADQVFGYCLHQLGSREEAEDAVQSTFLNAFRGLRRGVVPESEQAWLFKIAQNVCLSRRRSSWRRGRIESPAAFEFAQETAPAPSPRADELIGLQDVLERMPENQRRAILLREWQGLSYREIAAELELSQSAVETLIFRARRALAEGLESSPAEHRSWRAQLRPSLELGNLVGAAKTLLVGSFAVKAAGTAAVVAVTTVTVAQPVERHFVSQRHAHAPATASKARPSSSGSAARVPAAGERSTPSPAGSVEHKQVKHTQVKHKQKLKQPSGGTRAVSTQSLADVAPEQPQQATTPPLDGGAPPVGSDLTTSASEPPPPSDSASARGSDSRSRSAERRSERTSSSAAQANDHQHEETRAQLNVNRADVEQASSTPASEPPQAAVKQDDAQSAGKRSDEHSDAGNSGYSRQNGRQQQPSDTGSGAPATTPSPTPPSLGQPQGEPSPQEPPDAAARGRTPSVATTTTSVPSTPAPSGHNGGRERDRGRGKRR